VLNTICQIQRLSLISSLQYPNRVLIQTHKSADAADEYAIMKIIIIIIPRDDDQMVVNFKLSKKSFLSHLEPQMVIFLKVIISIVFPIATALRNHQTFSTLTYLPQHFSNFTPTPIHSMS